MSDWLISFLAATGLVGLVIWCAKIFMEIYVG